MKIQTMSFHASCGIFQFNDMKDCIYMSATEEFFQIIWKKEVKREFQPDKFEVLNLYFSECRGGTSNVCIEFFEFRAPGKDLRVER